MERTHHSIVEAVLACLHPEFVVATGCTSAEGLISLLELCRKNGAKLTVIEPRPAFDLEAVLKKHEAGLSIHQSLALNALRRIEGMDLVLMDPDPNWYTVHNSLLVIEEQAKKSGRAFPCVLIQHVGWPYGRRDAYLDPEVVPEAYRQPFQKGGVLPGEEGLVDHGGLFGDRNHAVKAGGSKNGVLTAVEDFLSDRKEALQWVSVPSFFGTGMLFDKGLVTSNAEFSSFVDSLRPGKPLEGILEECERERIGSELRIQAALAQSRQKIEEQRAGDEKRVEELSEQLKVLKEKRARDQKQLSDFKAQIDSTKKDLLATAKKLHEIEKELSDKEDQLLQLRQNRERLARELRGVNATIEELKEESQLQAKAIGELESANQALRKDLSAKNRRVSDLESELAEIAGERKVLVGWLDRLTEDMEAHFGSWTWKVGSLAIMPLRLMLRKQAVPVDDLRASRIAKSFRAWKEKSRGRGK